MSETETAIHVLAIEDVEADSLLMKEVIQSAGFTCSLERIETEDELRRALTESAPDVVLLDLQLPDLTVPRALDVVYGLRPGLPVIVVSGTISDADAIEYLRAGARDYVLKADLNRLGPAVFRAIQDSRARVQRESVQARAEALHRILDQATNEIYVMDAEDLRFLHVNRGAIENLGYSLTEMQLRSPVDLSPGLTTEMLLSRMQPLLSGAKTELAYDSTHKRKDGSTYPVELHIQTGDFEGRVAFVGIVIDISQKVESRARLEAALAEQRTLIEQLPAITYEAAPDESCSTRWISPQVEQGLGRPATDFTANPSLLVSLIHPEDRARALGSARGARGTGQITDMEFRIVHADGSVRWFRDRFTVLADEEGEPVAVRGVMFDITDTRQAEQQRTLLSAAVEQSASLIVITDRTGSIEYVNAAFEAVTGYSQAEVLGQNPRLLRSDEHTAGFYERMWGELTAGRAWTAEFTNRRKDGALYKQRSTVFPVHDPSGETTNYVSIGQDVTKELALEAQLSQSQRVESLGLLAGGIAHDFNNILTAILTNTEFVRTEISDPSREVIRDLREIRSAARTGSELVSKLMAFARDKTLELAVADLDAVVTEAVGILRRVLPESIAIRYESADVALPVLMDDGAVSQILMNLGTNSRDAMPKGGTLDLALLSVSPGQRAGLPSDAPSASYACLSVEDSGTGMDAATRVRVVEPFFTTKEMGKGTGLGMAQVLGLVQRLGGYLGVESTEGVGTTVSIFLPLTDAVVASVPTAARDDEHPEGSETILIVEDEHSIRRAEERILTGLGYRILTAEDGLQAIETLEREKGAIDLVLSDLVMPNMGGVDLYRAAQSMGNPPRFLFTSGYSDVEDVEGTQILKEAGFLRKPWEADELARAIRTALDKDVARQ